MKYRLSFADLNLLTHDIIEVIIDDGVVLSLEMMEEYEQFLVEHFKHDFAILVNRVHCYSYSYEVQLSIASIEQVKAIAIVNYSEQSKLSSAQLIKVRSIDNWNLKEFSGVEMGWQQAFNWLQQELVTLKVI